jgi:outer membrane receptor protein involved in Fe transport
VRKWRINLYGNYSFTEGRLKGANIGGAYRYVDSSAIGYGLKTVEDLVIPDVDTVYTGDSSHTFDIWAGYSFRVAKGVNWRIQLNVRNLFADDDPLVAQTQPDGSAARVRYAPPRTFLLQNTITF